MRFSTISANSLSILLVSLASIATVSGQTSTRKPLPTEPLEKYDNPPAFIYRLESGPRMISQYGPFVSYQVNVDNTGNNIIGDAANEPSIAVDPTDGNKMTIGWRQFNSVSSNFRQGGWGYTTDGGIHWTFPGVLENNVFRSDPVLGSNETGNFFYLSLRENFYDDIWRSTNGGQAWTRLTFGNVTGGDKEWFTIDTTNGMGHGFLYQAWSTGGNNWGGRQFSRSTDNGVTWISPIFIPSSPVWGTLDVTSNGNLFIGGAANFSSPFWCIRSSNAQNPAVTPTFDQSTQVNLGGSLVFDGGINPGGLAGQCFLAVDRSGGPTNDTIYMLASGEPFGGGGPDVMFARSTDGGVTWSPNVAVSTAFTPFEGYPNQNKIGDYITIVSDNTGGDVAYSATFNFNPSRGQHEQDVYFVRVSPAGGP